MEIQQRLQWVKLYKTSSDGGFVCRRCGKVERSQKTDKAEFYATVDL